MSNKERRTDKLSEEMTKDCHIAKFQTDCTKLTLFINIWSKTVTPIGVQIGRGHSSRTRKTTAMATTGFWLCVAASHSHSSTRADSAFLQLCINCCHRVLCVCVVMVSDKQKGQSASRSCSSDFPGMSWCRCLFLFLSHSLSFFLSPIDCAGSRSPVSHLIIKRKGRTRRRGKEGTEARRRPAPSAGPHFRSFSDNP